MNQQNKDAELWQLAQRRASFKSHLLIYIVMSSFFWLLWYFTGGRTYNRGVPWPVWPMLGWGIGVAFHYIGAFVAPKSNATEKEYEKLVQERNTNSNI
jgi:hypothetical protein